MSSVENGSSASDDGQTDQQKYGEKKVLHLQFYEVCQSTGCIFIVAPRCFAS